MKIDRNDLLVLLQTFARAEALPLDASEIHGSLEEAQEYAKAANAYAGQTIKVLVDGKYKQYILQPTDDGGIELQEVADVITVDGKLNDIKTEIISETKSYTDTTVSDNIMMVHKNDQKSDNPVKVVATDRDHVGTIVPTDGQVILVQDAAMICFDYDGKRTFYHDIITLDTEEERVALDNPIDGKFYFVIDTAILWNYNKGWNQLTNKPDDIVCIGVDLPDLGKEGTLYVDTAKKGIYVWDEKSHTYEGVANWCDVASDSELNNLFD